MLPKHSQAVDMTTSNPPINPPNHNRDGSFPTYALVQERLVEAREFWWRINRRGKWPFAGDGPWNLIQSEWGDYADEDAWPKPLPITRAQHARMTEALEWLMFVPVDEDRRLVCLAIEKLARGHKRVPWRDLIQPMKVKRGADALRMRYQRSIYLICRKIGNGAALENRTFSRVEAGQAPECS